MPDEENIVAATTDEERAKIHMRIVEMLKNYQINLISNM
jgi:hypothetical protein